MNPENILNLDNANVVHVYPAGMVGHVINPETGKCVCEPETEVADNGETLIVHKSDVS